MAGSASGLSLHLRNLVGELEFFAFSCSCRASLLGVFLYQIQNRISSDGLYGTWRKASTSKAGWNLPQPKMANTDLSALLKSEAIRAVLRAPNRKVSRAVVRTNPLKNIRTMLQVWIFFIFFFWKF